MCDKNREVVEMGVVAEVPVCITQHPGFQAVCVNRCCRQPGTDISSSILGPMKVPNINLTDT